MADRVTWGRPGSTGPDAWPDTYMVEPPEAAHAASEVDDEDERTGNVFVTAVCVGLITVAVALLSWAVITHR